MCYRIRWRGAKSPECRACGPGRTSYGPVYRARRPVSTPIAPPSRGWLGLRSVRAPPRMWRAAAALRRAGVAACSQTRRSRLLACHEEQCAQAGLQSTLLALAAAAVAGSPAWQARCELEPVATERDTTNASAKWRVYTDVGRDRVNQARARRFAPAATRHSQFAAGKSGRGGAVSEAGLARGAPRLRQQRRARRCCVEQPGRGVQVLAATPLAHATRLACLV